MKFLSILKHVRKLLQKTETEELRYANQFLTVKNQKNSKQYRFYINEFI